MTKELILVLDNLRSVENTASIFRTAECLGVSKIYLIGTTPAPIDRFGRKRKDFAKVSLGAESLISWEGASSISGVIQEIKPQGFKIVALEQHPKANKLTNQAANKLCLIVGNEVDGVSQKALDLSDEIVEIEMMGKKESLNVSVATGIALYQLLSFTKV